MTRAGPGEVLVSGRVRAALADAFALEPLEPIPLKGMPEPLPVFRLAGLRRRELRLSEPAYSLPMVGRQGELTVLSERLTLALQGQSQVVGIIAEAGMGKSRLVAEALRLARKRGLACYGGACQSYGVNTPYLVWTPIWRGLFELDPEQPLRRQLRALEGLLADWAPERVEALPLLGALLGLDLPENAFTRHLEPQYRKSALEALLMDCLAGAAREAQADGAGLLLVLEDLHWIDALSHDLLERVAQAIVELPVLIVLAYRPPELLRLQAPRIEVLAHFTRIELGPLTKGEAAQAIRAKLAQLLPERKGAVTPALIARITAKAEGNPFYVEELLNYLRDRGIDPQDAAALDRLELPTSLHSLILSRIDQLSERERAALKVASVIGRLFRFSWLHEGFPMLGEGVLLRADLEALARLDLTPLDTPEPELAYLFKHIVTQEVAYESLTAQARATLHEQLAAYLEQVAGDQTDQIVDLLAYHYERSDNLAKKREYLRRAGEAAAARFANEAAVDYLSRALALTDDEAERYELLLARTDVYDRQAAREAQADDLTAVEALADTLGDDRRRAVVATRWADYAYWVGDYSRVREAAERAVALASSAEITAVAVQAFSLWAWALVAVEQGAEALVRARQCLELARTTGEPASLALAQYALGDAMRVAGDVVAEQEHYEAALMSQPRPIRRRLTRPTRSGNLISRWRRRPAWPVSRSRSAI